MLPKIGNPSKIPASARAARTFHVVAGERDAKKSGREQCDDDACGDDRFNVTKMLGTRWQQEKWGAHDEQATDQKRNTSKKDHHGSKNLPWLKATA